ncbi:carbohydrate-binding module family 13 [Piromyces sp. E2]|nr:carbohydrate-binding module family 13 [Piromyces sp. E2]|eukprot:OUM60889.1 carbohydrate-binding module family 13 [Piromyces sp. E2]
MKTTIFSYFVLLSAALFNGFANAAGASSFSGVSPQKAIKNTNNKNPTITHRYSADPGVMVYKDRVYVYATNDGDVANKNYNENKYDQINTINCMSSSDLVNWMDHGPIAAAGPNGAARWAKNSWAPTAAWKTINGKDKFFLYFANNGSGIGVLTSDSPTGPFKDPLGRALITSQTPNCNTITWLFDPAVFVDSDGTGYIYFGGGVPQGRSANPGTVRVAKLGNDMTSLAGNPQTIDAPWVFEDSGIHKMGNTYYYSYCTNWDNGPYGNARIAYMTSNSPMGPFKYQGTCFNNPGDFFGTTGNNHHTIIEFKKKYYIFYHTEWLNKQVLGNPKGYRTTHVDEMPVSGDRLGNAKGTLTGVTQVQNVDGSALNYAACFAWQSGISVKGQAAVTTVNYSRGGWTGVSNVDLGSASSITIKASSSSGATIKICTGSENGQAIGYVEVGAGNTMKEYTGTISGASGVKNLFFVASGNVSVESWTFGGGSSGNTQPINENSNSNTPVTEPEVPQNNGPGSVVTDVVDGWYYIKNTGSEKYLTVAGNNGAANTNIEISSFSGEAGQKWKVTRNSEGYITLTSGLGDFMLDVANGKNNDGTNIIIYLAYGGEAQQYSLKSADGSSFIITTRVSNGGKALDVYNFGTSDGSNVCQWSVSGNTNQTWEFESVDGNKTNNGGNGGNGGNASCWSKTLGYPCCSGCLPVYYDDNDGEWSIENGDWCGIPKNCDAAMSNSVSQCKEVQGYKCCKKSCIEYSNEDNVRWSVEDNNWCVIDPSICA